MCFRIFVPALGRSKEWADDWARGVEARWRVHAESVYCDAGQELNFHGQTQLVCRAGMLNGEAPGLPLWLERPWHPYRSATQLIEADRLSNPQMAPDTERLRGGIERDRYGAPDAYWIRRTRPGDLVAGWLAYGAGEWERIPARTE